MYSNGFNVPNLFVEAMAHAMKRNMFLTAERFLMAVLPVLPPSISVQPVNLYLPAEEPNAVCILGVCTP